jgi:hypothetical protein
MNTRDLRRDIKRRIDCLSPQSLRAAAGFLAYLEERESIEATEELLSIPGFLERFEEGCKDIAAGRTVPFEKIRWKK